MAKILARGILFCLITSLTAPLARGQDPVLNNLYGNGVHAYFARNYDQAHQHLSDAIKQGFRDPRCFYFRGLSNAQIGRPDASLADFKMGAEIEALSDLPLHPISKSLERVQGRIRIQLEGYRQQARIDAVQLQRERELARYERFQRDENRVLRSSIPENSSSDITIEGEAPSKNPFDSEETINGSQKQVPTLTNNNRATPDIEAIPQKSISDNQPDKDTTDLFGNGEQENLFSDLSAGEHDPKQKKGPLSSLVRALQGALPKLDINQVRQVMPAGRTAQPAQIGNPFEDTSAQQKTEDPFDDVIAKEEEDNPFDDVVAEEEEEDNPFNDVVAEEEEDNPFDDESNEEEEEEDNPFDDESNEEEEDNPFDNDG